MNNKLKLILSISLLCLLIIGFAINGKNLIKNPKLENSDAIKFKEEYESLNNKDNGYDGKYLRISINDDNVIKYASFEELIDLLDKGTGVIYFGFPECPWCRNAVPSLLEAADSTGIEQIYYFNAVDIRDQKTLDANGEVITTKEGTEEYKELLKKLDKYLLPYDGLNDESIKRLYFPSVYFIKDGVVIGKHIDTVESHTDASKELNEKQKLELKGIYENYMMEILDSSCDKEC